MIDAAKKVQDLNLERVKINHELKLLKLNESRFTIKYCDLCFS